jgi:hypothetical protein
MVVAREIRTGAAIWACNQLVQLSGWSVQSVQNPRVTSSLGVAKKHLTPHAKTAGEATGLTKGDRRTAGKAGCHAIGQIRNDGILSSALETVMQILWGTIFGH